MVFLSLQNSASDTVDITVTATPDNATLTCDETILNVSATMSCQLVALLSGQAIYTTNSSFSVAVSGSSGTVGGVSPAVSSSFAFDFTADSSVTGISDISSGIAGSEEHRVTVIGRASWHTCAMQ